MTCNSNSNHPELFFHKLHNHTALEKHKVCVCCAANESKFVYLKKCLHSSFWNCVPGFTVKDNDMVCMVCHTLLKKIHTFKLQVEESMQLLGEQVQNPLNTKTIKLQRTNIQTVSSCDQTLPIEPIPKDLVKKEIEDVAEQESMHHSVSDTNDFESVELTSDCKQEFESESYAETPDSYKNYPYTVPVLGNTCNTGKRSVNESQESKIDVVGGYANTYVKILPKEKLPADFVQKPTTKQSNFITILPIKTLNTDYADFVQEQNTLARKLPKQTVQLVSEQRYLKKCNKQNTHETTVANEITPSTYEISLKDTYIKMLLDRKSTGLKVSSGEGSKNKHTDQLDWILPEELVPPKPSEKPSTEMPPPHYIYACDKCGQVFKYRHSLVSHIENYHNLKLHLQCSQCNKTYKSSKCLKQHINNVHGDKKSKKQLVPVKCDVCSKMVRCKTALYYHKKNRHPDKVDKLEDRYCVQCDKEFPTKHGYTQHMTNSRKHASGKFECNDCGKSFTGKCRLRSHILHIHMRKRDFACSVCGKKYVKRNVMRDHENYKHFGVERENRYVCSVCGKAFKWGGSLKNHMLIHKGQKDHHCELCPMRFTQKSTLTTHCKLKHKDFYHKSKKRSERTEIGDAEVEKDK